MFLGRGSLCISIAFSLLASGDRARTRPTRGNPINPWTDAHLRTSSGDRFPPFSEQEAAPLERRSPAPRLDSWRTTRRGVCHQDSGDRSGQWEEVEGVDRGGHGGQCARTTRQSRGLSRRHENGPTVLLAARHRVRPCGISRSQSRRAHLVGKATEGS